MKYILVDKLDNICGRVNSDKIENAKHYFIGRKKIDESNFDNLWKVMTEEQYEAIQRASLQNKQYEWWKDEESYLDIDKP
jgi:hypothetical protein